MNSIETIKALESWAGQYYQNIEGKLAQLEAVEIPHIDIKNPWANGQSPLIYQHPDELEAFLSALQERGLDNTALEIGFENGGLHVILREVFSKVVSLELSLHKILNFLSHSSVDERSVLICGNSTQRKTITTVQKHCNNLDLLFIDADHTYAGVYNDYILYKDLVREGGIIAFHDTAGRCDTHVDIQNFLTGLRNGEIDGKPHHVVDIIKSGTGISYEVMEKNPRWWLVSAEFDKKVDELESKIEANGEIIAKLNNQLQETAQEITAKQRLISQRDETIKAQQQIIDQHLATVNNQQQCISQRDETIKAQQQIIDQHLATINNQQQCISQRDDTIKAQQQIIDQHLATINNQQQCISQRDDTIKSQQQIIDQHLATINNQQQCISQGDDTVKSQQRIIDQHLATINNQQQCISQRDDTVKAQQQVIAERETTISSQQQILHEWGADIRKQTELIIEKGKKIDMLQTTFLEKEGVIQKLTIENAELRHWISSWQTELVEIKSSSWYRFAEKFKINPKTEEENQQC